MPPPTVTRPGTPPVSTQPNQPPQTDPASTGTTSHASSSNALVRFQGTSALPNRRPSISGTEASTSTAATAATGAIATTRRRGNALLAKAQTERAAAEMAQQIQQLAMKEIGSLEPSAVQAYFESNVPRLLGAQAPAQARLLKLFADAGIPDGEKIVTEAMQAVDRSMLAALGSGEGPSTALQRTTGPADEAALQRLFDAIEQMRTRAPTVETDTGVETGTDTGRIHELADDQEAERFLAGGRITATPDDTGRSDSLSITRADTPPVTEVDTPIVAKVDTPPVSGDGDTAATAGAGARFSAADIQHVVDFVTDALKSVPDLLATIMNNRDFDSKTAQWAATTLNVVLRNLASVGVTTFGRELLAYGIEIALERNGVSKPVRTGISALMGPGYSTMTHLVGAFRDVMDGGASKEDLRDSLIGRGVSVLTAAGAFYAENAFDLAHTTTATHAAMTAYTHARDVGVQSWLRLPAKQNPPEDKTHFTFMSVFYGLDQMIVPMLMLMLAPKSGAGAARAGLGMAEVAKAAGIRAALNTAGEAAEDLANEGNRAIRAGHAPEVGLQVDFKQRHFVNGLLGQQSVRTAIISEAQSLVPIISTKMAEAGKSDMATLMVIALMIGGVNGVQYWPFARGFAAQPKVGAPPTDEEHGLDTLDPSTTVGDTQVTPLPLPDPAVLR